MILWALVLKMKCSRTHSRALATVSLHKIGNVLSHLLPQCETLFFAYQFIRFWLAGVSSWASLQHIGGYLDKRVATQWLKATVPDRKSDSLHLPVLPLLCAWARQLKTCTRRGRAICTSVWSASTEDCTSGNETRTQNALGRQWRTVAILVWCSTGSQPAQNCEGSPALVVLAYHKPFEHLNRLAVDHNNQTTRSTYPRTSTASGTNKNRINSLDFSWQNFSNWNHWWEINSIFDTE